MKLTNTLSTVTLCVGIILTSAIAKSSTVDSFAFTQTGFTGGGTLTGSFTGTVEADGYIELSDLSAFNAAFTVPFGSGDSTGYFYQTDLHLFSVLTAADGPNSSLDFYAQPQGLPQNVCVGAAAAFGLCGDGGAFVGLSNIAGATDASTSNLPVLTLLSSVSSNPPANAPEPATLSICGLTLMAAGLWRRSKKRASVVKLPGGQDKLETAQIK